MFKKNKTVWSVVEASIYELNSTYKMYFDLYQDNKRKVTQTRKTKCLKNVMVHVDYDKDDNIIGVEILGDQ